MKLHQNWHRYVTYLRSLFILVTAYHFRYGVTNPAGTLCYKFFICKNVTEMTCNDREVLDWF